MLAEKTDIISTIIFFTLTSIPSFTDTVYDISLGFQNLNFPKNPCLSGLSFHLVSSLYLVCSFFFLISLIFDIFILSNLLILLKSNPSISIFANHSRIICKHFLALMKYSVINFCIQAAFATLLILLKFFLK